ncbi:MAG: hypothetical protein CL928_04360 [Deltaproteobacteria bacterium]|nr:hypothetical protein [Deltaproteobacteria bacterium]
MPEKAPCDDSDPHTWDHCDDSAKSCGSYLADGVRACASDSQCQTQHPCQRFLCEEGLCRLTEPSRFCGDAFLRPVACSGQDDCVRHQLWMLSPAERALSTLAGGPWCITQADGGRYCRWFDASSGPGAESP